MVAVSSSNFSEIFIQTQVRLFTLFLHFFAKVCEHQIQGKISVYFMLNSPQYTHHQLEFASSLQHFSGIFGLTEQDEIPHFKGFEVARARSLHAEIPHHRLNLATLF